jgi:hypothetical protein
MSKTYLLVAGFLATTLASTSAFGQTMPGAAIPAPTAAPVVSRPADLPPNMMLNQRDELGRPVFMSTEQAIAQYGEPTVRAVVKANQATCGTMAQMRVDRAALDQQLEELNRRAQKNGKSRKAWTIGRTALGVGQVAAGWALGGPLYGLVAALGQAQATGDRLEYAALMRMYLAYMEYHSGEMKLYSGMSSMWMDSMNLWCGAMNGYMARTGTPATPPTATPAQK